MKYLLLAIFTFSVLVGFSQKEVATQEELKTFFKTKTLVVVDDNPLSEYNMEIKDAVKKNWKLTEYEFISLVDYEEKRKDPAFSFLTIDKVFYDKDKTKAQYEFLCLSLGGDYRTPGDAPQLCAFPLCYFGVDEESYVYKIGSIVNFVQNHVLMTSENAELTSTNIIRIYNENIKSIKGKTLYIVKDEMGPKVNSEAKVKKVYPLDFKFVTRDDVQEAIAANDDKIVFLHKVGPEGTKRKARCFKALMGAADAKLYYFNYHMIDNEKAPDGFLLKDFKRLAKQ